MTFEKLNSITEIEVNFKTLGTLAIGAGDQPDAAVDTPIIRIGGEPVIPGSSLKGALRSSLEAILSGKNAPVCVPFTAVPQEIRRNRNKNVLKQYLKGLGRLDSCDPDKEVCGVCEIFGTAGGGSGLSGRAVVMDARLSKEYDPAILTERMHVAITRDTRSQAGGGLMNIEAVDEGVEFKGTIRLFNPENWHVGAILRGLELVSKMGLGAKKTSGYGQLKITPASIITLSLGGKGWQEEPGEISVYEQAFDGKQKWPRQKA